MKHVFTVSLDIETVAKIREAARSSRYRNKSHLVEEALKDFLKNNSNNNSNSNSKTSKEVGE
ncbi:ribbon-helix-helix protein, CopG family [Candidatus Woesearchaeota archaeon]|jgi:metal-responsive CopG/Arc/MetJ family transcriptional regulator|nr:ribbon-helix-helix protein, CopG family [Candidatus Woesearchaeota archaeon]